MRLSLSNPGAAPAGPRNASPLRRKPPARHGFLGPAARGAALTLACAASAVLARPAAAQSSYAVTPIPLLKNASSATPYALNSSSEVVGTSSTGTGWYWKSSVNSGNPVSISPPPGTTATGPRAINARSTVVGYASGYVFVRKNGTQALKLNQISANAPGMYMALNDNDQVISTYDVSSGGLTVPHGCAFEKNASGAWVTTPEDLPPLAGDNASQAHAINNNGLVIGTSFVFTLDANGNPVYGTVDNPMHLTAWRKDPTTGAWQPSAIPDTTTGATRYSVTNVNINGEASGNCSTPTSNQQGFFVDTSSFAITTLTSFAGATGTSKVHGLNDSGQVCGWSDLASGRHAVYWDKTRGANNWLDLGSLGTGTQSRAAGSSSDLEVFHSINSLGYVVGFSVTNSGASDGFVWDASHGMRDLNAITPSKSGFTQLGNAWAISDTGQIVGVGTYKGKSTAYLLTP